MKKRVIQGLSFSMVLMLSLFSCKKDKPSTVNLGYNYFPTHVGHWVIYNVDSIYYYAFKLDTLRYQVKQVIDSIYTDNSGNPAVRIVRWKRSNPDSAWVIQKVWHASLTATNMVMYEDNVPYMKLIFPPKLNSTWNGNILNTNAELDYQYTSVDQPFTLNSAYFDSTSMIIQDSNLNLVSHSYAMEMYARNVGLIWRKIEYLEYTTIPAVDSLALPNLIVTPTLMATVDDNSLIYTETYVSSGN
ncbi:MAG TPA: hypothetical protein VK806_02885 [Bacteroidia bacterium]|jgi:hypothetical protein|nr:hypothetical protein [Bacteroidia bacterium]